MCFHGGRCTRPLDKLCSAHRLLIDCLHLVSLHWRPFVEMGRSEGGETERQTDPPRRKREVVVLFSRELSRAHAAQFPPFSPPSSSKNGPLLRFLHIYIYIYIFDGFPQFDELTTREYSKYRRVCIQQEEEGGGGVKFLEMARACVHSVHSLLR